MISALRVVGFHPSDLFTTEMNSDPGERKRPGRAREKKGMLPKGKGEVLAKIADSR